MKFTVPLSKLILTIKNPRLVALLGCAGLREKKSDIRNFHKIEPCISFIENHIDVQEPISYEELSDGCENLNIYSDDAPYWINFTKTYILSNFLRSNLRYLYLKSDSHFCDLRNHLSRLVQKNWRSLVSRKVYSNFFAKLENMPIFPEFIKHIAQDVYDYKTHPGILYDALYDLGYVAESLKGPVYKGSYLLDHILGNR